MGFSNTFGIGGISSAFFRFGLGSAFLCKSFLFAVQNDIVKKISFRIRAYKTAPQSVFAWVIFLYIRGFFVRIFKGFSV